MQCNRWGDSKLSHARGACGQPGIARSEPVVRSVGQGSRRAESGCGLSLRFRHRIFEGAQQARKMRFRGREGRFWPSNGGGWPGNCALAPALRTDCRRVDRVRPNPPTARRHAVAGLTGRQRSRRCGSRSRPTQSRCVLHVSVEAGLGSPFGGRKSVNCQCPARCPRLAGPRGEPMSPWRVVAVEYD